MAKPFRRLRYEIAFSIAENIRLNVRAGGTIRGRRRADEVEVREGNVGAAE